MKIYDQFDTQIAKSFVFRFTLLCAFVIIQNTVVTSSGSLILTYQMSCPAGWERLESRSKPGKFYYFNADTGKTSWKVPAPVTSNKTRGRPLPSIPSSADSSPRNSGIPPRIVEEKQRVIKFNAKLVVTIDSGKNLSNSKGTYWCDISLWRNYGGGEAMVPEEEYETERVDGTTPVWKQKFQFGSKSLNLETVDFFKIEVFRKTMFSSKAMGVVRVAFDVFRKANNMERSKMNVLSWYVLEKTKKMKTVSGELCLTLDYRPGGEFLEGEYKSDAGAMQL